VDITEQLEAKGVTLRVLDQNLETTTAQGKLMFTMLGAFAEFETALRKERQMEGIAKAKAAGKYTGRPKSIDEDAIKATLLEGGKSLREIATLHGVSRATVHRLSTRMRGWGAELIECVYRLSLGPSKGPITGTVPKNIRKLIYPDQ
jgi:DNA invertase Pin-like site-specific DNA recombinase